MSNRQAALPSPGALKSTNSLNFDYPIMIAVDESSLRKAMSTARFWSLALLVSA